MLTDTNRTVLRGHKTERQQLSSIAEVIKGQAVDGGGLKKIYFRRRNKQLTGRCSKIGTLCE